MADARRFEGASLGLSSSLPRDAHAGGEGMRAVLSRDVALIAKSIDVASATAVLAESPSTTPSRCGATPKVANGMAGAPASVAVTGRLKSRGPNRSMSGSNQQLMRINLRRMELSVFIEVLSTHSIKRRRPGRQEGATAEKAVPSSVPLFDGKPSVTCIEAMDGQRTARLLG